MKCPSHGDGSAAGRKQGCWGLLRALPYLCRAFPFLMVSVMCGVMASAHSHPLKYLCIRFVSVVSHVWMRALQPWDHFTDSHQLGHGMMLLPLPFLTPARWPSSQVTTIPANRAEFIVVMSVPKTFLFIPSELILMCGNAAISFDLQRQSETLLLPSGALLSVSGDSGWSGLLPWSCVWALPDQ